MINGQEDVSTKFDVHVGYIEGGRRYIFLPKNLKKLSPGKIIPSFFTIIRFLHFKQGCTHSDKALSVSKLIKY